MNPIIEDGEDDPPPAKDEGEEFGEAGSEVDAEVAVDDVVVVVTVSEGHVLLFLLEHRGGIDEIAVDVAGGVALDEEGQGAYIGMADDEVTI